MSQHYIDIIRGANKLRKVKIRYSKSKSGNLNLFLEYCHDNKRERVYLGLSVTGKLQYRGADERSMIHAMQKRDELEKIILAGGSLREIPSGSFIDYARSIAAQKREVNREVYDIAISRFSGVIRDGATTDITLHTVKAFLRTLGSLSPNTRNHYVFALRHICDKAIEDGIIDKNPFAWVKKEKVVTHKEFLSLDEVKTLMITPCEIEDVKRAFLFSCFTGLRYGDIISISSSNIKDGYLNWTQRKTGTHERILIPEIALQYAPSPRYSLPVYTSVNDRLKQWIRHAGIDKRITFHCARHTFATLCITLGVDIYTVSKLLGHADVRMTQVYAKLVDEKKDQAAAMISKVF